jgi:hypothetical protein
VSPHRLEAELDPRLVEAALLAAARGHVEGPEFQDERARLYEIAEPEAREAAFADHHARWFERLGLDRPFREALAEQPALAAGCRRWLVARARAARDEAADLLVAPGAPPTLVTRVTPETVAAPDRLRVLLRRELLHVADMLDPRFGYSPVLPADVSGGPRERLVRDNYRVLWSTYVDGRLAGRGLLPSAVRSARWREFAGAFPHLGARAEAVFERFFDAHGLSHQDLLGVAAGGPDAAPAPRCRLCDLPTRAFEPAPGALPPAVRAAIARDFPAWRSPDGLCCRCAELYAARAAACS